MFLRKGLGVSSRITDNAGGKLNVSSVPLVVKGLGHFTTASERSPRRILPREKKSSRLKEILSVDEINLNAR